MKLEHWRPTTRKLSEIGTLTKRRVSPVVLPEVPFKSTKVEKRGIESPAHRQNLETALIQMGEISPWTGPDDLERLTDKQRQILASARKRSCQRSVGPYRTPSSHRRTNDMRSAIDSLRDQLDGLRQAIADLHRKGKTNVDAQKRVLEPLTSLSESVVRLADEVSSFVGVGTKKDGLEDFVERIRHGEKLDSPFASEMSRLASELKALNQDVSELSQKKNNDLRIELSRVEIHLRYMVGEMEDLNLFIGNEVDSAFEEVAQGVKDPVEPPPPGSFWGNDLLKKAKELGFTPGEVNEAVRGLSTMPLTINFEPGKMVKLPGQTEERSVIGLMEHDHRYRDVFETGTSGNTGENGSYSSPDRQRELRSKQERMLYGDDVQLNEGEHPIYFSFDVFKRAIGGAPRFGSSYLVLKQDVLERSTMGPSTGMGPATTPDLPHFQLCSLHDRFSAVMRMLLGGPSEQAEGAVEEQFGLFEGHLFGTVEFDLDIEAIVCDTKYRDTVHEESIRSFAKKNNVELRWHDGDQVVVD